MCFSVADCRLIPFPSFTDDRGCLSFAEGEQHVPFKIARVFLVHQLHAGTERGHHAHRECEFVLIAAHGEFEITLDDGEEKSAFRLTEPNGGLHLPPGIWTSFRCLTEGGVLVSLASAPFRESDYIRDLHEFENWRAELRGR